MPKSAQAFRTIREVADWLDVAAHVLRFWESKFNQIKPVKRAGGRRYYRPADMELVGGIKVLLHERGLTIRGVQKMIADEGVEAVTSLSPPIDELIADANVIDMDADEAWAEDEAAEVEDTVETPLPDATEPEPEAPEERVEEATAAPPEAEDPTTPEPVAEEPIAPEPVASEPVTPEPIASEPIAEAPEQAPATATEDPLPQEAPPTEQPVAADPAPIAPPISTPPAPEPTPQPAPSPPAEGTLGTLAALSRLPATQRAAMRPQIIALAQLRDRMSAPLKIG